MPDDRPMHPDTAAIHVGHAIDPSTGAVAPAIHVSTTFLRAEDGSFPSGYIYGREKAPNRVALEFALATLEGGATALAFSTGQASVSAVFQSLKSGDHVILPRSVYYGTPKLVREVFAPWGLTFDAVDMTDLAAVRRACKPSTRLIWIETPSNPLLTITDIAGVAAIAKEHGALLAVDNTWGTPICQRPIALGADIVMHSTTKYIGGHSDVSGGALILAKDDEFATRLRMIQATVGAIPSPFDAWLLRRGLMTLGVRVRQHVANAKIVAEMLAKHPKVAKVHYPGLPSHPGNAIAARQMDLFGGMVSFEVDGGQPAAFAIANRLRIFTRATSLGGVESLVEHRKSIEGPESPTPDGLLRLSIGLEHAEDLVRDLAHALA